MRKEKTVIVIYLLFMGVLTLPFILPEIIPKEVNSELKYFNYTDLEIVNSQKPKNTHLLIETSDGNLWLADSVDPAKLYYSIDKGDNWILKTTRVDKIKMFYYDRTNEKLYAVDGTTADASSSHQFYIDISDTGTPYAITEGDLGGGNDEMIDIIWDGTRAFAMKFVRNGAGGGTTEFFANEFNDVFVDASGSLGDLFAGKSYDMTPGVVIAGFDWFLYWHEDGNVELWKYEIAANGWTNMEDCGAGTSLPVKNMQGIAYDGSDILYFILVVGAVNKLYTYTITTDTLTQIGTYDIALMMNRNTATGVMEKAFHITNLEVYQLHPNTPHQLHLIAKINKTGHKIIAITDNFLITDTA